MSTKKFWAIVIGISGIVISIIGAVLIGSYIFEAYISQIGNPDQSLLFWYLPFLFAGFIILVIGMAFIFWRFNQPGKPKMNSLFNKIFMLVIIILVNVPISIIITIVLIPFWSWFENSIGIESLGHSGPAEWCYAAIFFLLVGDNNSIISCPSK